jgi:D-alanyl-D-alanine carboxypeptidase
MGEMPMNRIQLFAVVGLVVVAGLAPTSGAASAPARGKGSSAPPPVERVARELRTGAKSVIVFVSDGDKGYVATGGARLPTGDQRFRVGSVTKTFTATIVLKLVEEGALRLDSTLEDHVPGVIPRGAEITIRQLLQHRSGIADVTDYPSWLESALRSSSSRPIDTLRFAGSKPLVFAPGSQGRYSNTNYIALGLVIEKVTGRSYAQELEERILKPLGLDNTELPETRRLPDLDDGGYNPNVPWAAGAIVSNAHDLSRFYSAFLSGRILSSATLATMKKTVEGVGLGIFSTELPCGRFWGHAGGILDYLNLVSASEEGDRVAVVSLRGPGLPPPVERALFCAEPPPAAGNWEVYVMSGARRTSSRSPGRPYGRNSARPLGRQEEGRARSARGLGPPRETSPPSSHTSSGPRIRNSISSPCRPGQASTPGSQEAGGKAVCGSRATTTGARTPKASSPVRSALHETERRARTPLRPAVAGLKRT